MIETLVHIFRGLLGIGAIILFCYGFSTDRKSINWRLVGSGLLLQFSIALLVFQVQFVADRLRGITEFFISMLGFALEGAAFVFGELTTDDSMASFFAFRVLPTIVFFSAMMSLLYYLGILQKVVFAFAWVMSKTMRLSGAESLAAAANVFIGQTEAPLIVKPYLERMTRSEINCLMTGGMATAAGSVFPGYIFTIAGNDSALQLEIGSRLMAAFIMAAPAAVVCAKLLYPQDTEINTDLKVPRDVIGINAFDALTNGTAQGVRLAVNVGAVVIVFLSLVPLINYMTLNWIGSWTGLNEVIVSWSGARFDGLTLQFMFSILFAPVAWIIGVDNEHVLLVGQLLGMKLVVADFPTYAAFREMLEAGMFTNDRAMIMATFAVCGFAAFVSVGVQVGGLPVLAPNQRENFASLGIRALAGGFCASLLSAAMAGIMLA